VKKKLLPLWICRKPCGCVVYAVGENPPTDSEDTFERLPDGAEVEFKTCGRHGGVK
jgi:hypothetical protein